MTRYRYIQVHVWKLPRYFGIIQTFTNFGLSGMFLHFYSEFRHRPMYTSSQNYKSYISFFQCSQRKLFHYNFHLHTKICNSKYLSYFQKYQIYFENRN